MKAEEIKTGDQLRGADGRVIDTASHVSKSANGFSVVVTWRDGGPDGAGTPCSTWVYDDDVPMTRPHAGRLTG
jgi:hypothetical protein